MIKDDVYFLYKLNIHISTSNDERETGEKEIFVWDKKKTKRIDDRYHKSMCDRAIKNLILKNMDKLNKPIFQSHERKTILFL